MPKYKFESKKLPRKIAHDPRHDYLDPKDPKIKIGSSRIFIPPTIYEKELSKPTRISLKVDESHKALLLTGDDKGHRVTVLKYRHGQIAYTILSPWPGAGRPMSSYIGKLPFGLYKSIGGNIFEYDTSANKQS